MADITRVALLVEDLDEETIAQLKRVAAGDRSLEAGQRIPEEAFALNDLMDDQ